MGNWYDPCAWNHNFFHAVFLKVEDAPDHRRLLGCENTLRFAGRQDDSKFLLRDGEVSASWAGRISLPEQPQQAVGGMVEEPDG